jgi:hypothetical protein
MLLIAMQTLDCCAYFEKEMEHKSTKRFTLSFMLSYHTKTAPWKKCLTPSTPTMALPTDKATQDAHSKATQDTTNEWVKKMRQQFLDGTFCDMIIRVTVPSPTSSESRDLS